MLKSKINCNYARHDCQRISQGDILRDFTFVITGKGGNQLELKFPYIVVLSQDCDLEHGAKLVPLQESSPEESIIDFNQYLHNILFLPAFPSEFVRNGQYLKDLFKMQTTTINSDRFRVIKSNENPRYHIMSPDAEFQIPELAIDFKAYYTVQFNSFYESYKDHYLATTNELFRENLSQRFAYYLNRVVLPELSV